MTSETAENTPGSFQDVLQALTSNKDVPLSGLPGFQTIVKQLTQSILTDLEKSWSIAGKLKVTCEDGISGAAFTAQKPGYSHAVIQAVDWRAAMPVLVPNPLIRTITAQALGGAESPVKTEGDIPLSRIEKQIADKFLAALLDILKRVFAPVLPTVFRLAYFSETASEDELIHTEAEFLRLTMRLQQGEAGFDLMLGLPLASLAVVGDKLKHVSDETPPVEQTAPDPEAPDTLIATKIRLDAFLDGGNQPLDNFRHIQPGMIFPLESGMQSLVALRCGEYPVFMCRLGQHAGKFNLKIDSMTEAPEELMDELFLSFSAEQTAPPA